MNIQTSLECFTSVVLILARLPPLCISIYWDGRGSTPYDLIRFTSRGFSMVGLFLIIVFWIALKRSISSLGNLD